MSVYLILKVTEAVSEAFPGILYRGGINGMDYGKNILLYSALLHFSHKLKRKNYSHYWFPYLLSGKPPTMYWMGLFREGRRTSLKPGVSRQGHHHQPVN
jgi:hypothetical protein